MLTTDQTLLINVVIARMTGILTVTPDELEQRMRDALAWLNINLESHELNAVRANLEERFTVWTGPGVTLQDPTDHEPWIAARRASIRWSLYERYRSYLQQERWSSSALVRLDELSEEILGLLEDPERPGPWDRRGMVVGQVQSGKTASYTALINRALDAGYRLIIVLAGRFNDLRSQTQHRIDEGVLGVDTQTARADRSQHRIGVGRLSGHGSALRVLSVTTSASNGDFPSNAGGLSPDSAPLVMVVKKQISVLRRVLQWCRRHQNIPVLLIDDEADDSSVNTRPVADEDGNPDPDLEPTAINGRIRQLLKTFSRSCYVGYTATPFANIFIHQNLPSEEYGEDLFPRSFIVSLPAPDNYIGPERIFGLNDDPVLGHGRRGAGVTREVDDWQGWMPALHRKDWRPPPALPDSLGRAIRCFILTVAARRARGQRGEHASMLIHVTRFRTVQQAVKLQVDAELRILRDRIRFENDASGGIRLELRALWEEEFAGDAVLSWEAVSAALVEGSSEIQVSKINGESQDSLQYYEHRETGLKVIAIGGDKLSRGLTLEGLSTSYYLRVPSAYDTLLQMGRWFGYRRGYADLCRIFTTHDLVEHYAHVTIASEELRQQFELMSERGMTPEQFGLRVRTDPGQVMTPTARNKMRSGESLRLSYADSLSEQVTFLRAPDEAARNQAAVEEFLASLGHPEGTGQSSNRVWRDVQVDRILGLLESYQVPPQSYRMRPDTLMSYIRQRQSSGKLGVWTVVLVSNSRTQDMASLAGHTVGRTRRALLYHDGSRVSVRRLLSPPDEGRDLTAEQQQLCMVVRKGPTGETRVFAPGRARGLRPPERGLLLVYALTVQDREDDSGNGVAMDEGTGGAVLSTVGLALSFPADPGAIPVEYLVNETYQVNGYGEDSL